MQIKVISWFILLFFSGLSFSATKIVLASENSWPPYSFVDGTGISKNKILAAYQSVDVEVEIIAVP